MKITILANIWQQLLNGIEIEMISRVLILLNYIIPSWNLEKTKVKIILNSSWTSTKIIYYQPDSPPGGNSKTVKKGDREDDNDHEKELVVLGPKLL